MLKICVAVVFVWLKTYIHIAINHKTFYESHQQTLHVACIECLQKSIRCGRGHNLHI